MNSATAAFIPDNGTLLGISYDPAVSDANGKKYDDWIPVIKLWT